MTNDRPPQPAADAYGRGSAGSEIDFASFGLDADGLDAADAEPFAAELPGNGGDPFADDLPDAQVGTAEDFLAAVGAAAPPVAAPDSPRAKRARRKAQQRAANPAARTATAGAAADLLDTVRGEPSDGVALPPRRRGKKSPRPAGAEESPGTGVNLNHVVLLSVLAVPAAAFGLYAAFGERQSTRAEWARAFDTLDDLMNEFVDAAHAPDEEWRAWAGRFEEARPELLFLVEGAPEESAGGDVRRAVGSLEKAVELRRAGAPPEALAGAVRGAVEHAKSAAVRLGLTKYEWAS